MVKLFENVVVVVVVVAAAAAAVEGAGGARGGAGSGGDECGWGWQQKTRSPGANCQKCKQSSLNRFKLQKQNNRGLPKPCPVIAETAKTKLSAYSQTLA